MYSKDKEQTYQNTANMLKNASSYREVLVPVSEVAIQFTELLNEVKRVGKNNVGVTEDGFEATTEKKSKGGKKAKE